MSSERGKTVCSSTQRCAGTYEALSTAAPGARATVPLTVDGCPQTRSGSCEVLPGSVIDAESAATPFGHWSPQTRMFTSTTSS